MIRLGSVGVFIQFFQSPFHRVKDCNDETGRGRIPSALHFQSPFHRVKDCNMCWQPKRFGSFGFQSPFHRVKDCNILANIGGIGDIGLSVPFSSGQGL